MKTQPGHQGGKSPQNSPLVSSKHLCPPVRLPTERNCTNDCTSQAVCTIAIENICMKRQ